MDDIDFIDDVRFLASWMFPNGHTVMLTGGFDFQA